MSEYKSFLHEIILFFAFMTASQHWNNFYKKIFKSFDTYLSADFPDASELTQEMADSLCQKHATESMNLCLARTNVVIALIRYMNKRNLTKIKEPERPKTQKCNHLPMRLQVRLYSDQATDKHKTLA